MVEDRLTIVHNEARSRFEVALGPGGERGELLYRRAGERIVFTHTGVPHAYRERGIGGRLVQAGLEYARREGLVVEPRCPFVARYIREHPEFAELLRAA
jgi:uncharacterized protein